MSIKLKVSEIENVAERFPFSHQNKPPPEPSQICYVSAKSITGRVLPEQETVLLGSGGARLAMLFVFKIDKSF